MRESLGGSMLLNLVVIFTSLIIVVFIGILSYSKAYKIKNRIVELIEKYGVYEEKSSEDTYVELEINPDLSAAGYDASTPTRCDNIKNRIELEKINTDKNNNNPKILEGNLNNHGYNYCIFKYCDKVDMESDEEKCDYKASTYIVVTFIKFEIPIIENVLTFPVYGETKILGKDYNY